jgi:hypothetical protein
VVVIGGIWGSTAVSEWRGQCGMEASAPRIVCGIHRPVSPV